MDYLENVKELKISMRIKEDKKGAKHTINVRAPFLPFKTRKPERPKFKRGFNGVVGEVARILSENKFSKDINLEECVSEITSVVECKYEEDEKYLKEIITNYLLDKDGDINLFHPYLYQYIQLTEGPEGKGESDIARFICDVILMNNYKFKSFFEKNDTNHMITKLIISKLDNLVHYESKEVFVNNLSFISDVAIEDVDFLYKHKEFFLKNFSNLLAYYYFYYITQLGIKLNKRSGADYSKPEEIYYLLDWESASRNRKSVENGYKLIKSQCKNLLININIIEHLNFIFGVKNKNFKQIYDLFKAMNEYEKKELLEALKKWVDFYIDFFELEKIETPLEYESLVKVLSDSLIAQNELAIRSRYFLSIEEIGKKYFLKVRGGTYGYMLNITQEMLLLITAISIKEEKITLKSLFKEYERRGIFFDNYSKEKVVELLDKLNLIDKKSDSGDAQYVKSIL
ncbi:DNA phosphorothioation-dependent restriction protein DptG [Clostridium baratii]|uniref:DNA phosphorothioation-dependent restriction protein DptG n=1 Tax=Clostridium baratii TaxID=1561 RepID=UPI0006BAAEB2|nr:DNA phosphorothioation-dependent restriction protein DptG [Clostridium baratii]